jgi:hypothetical protein
MTEPQVLLAPVQQYLAPPRCAVLSTISPTGARERLSLLIRPQRVFEYGGG